MLLNSGANGKTEKQCSSRRHRFISVMNWCGEVVKAIILKNSIFRNLKNCVFICRKFSLISLIKYNNRKILKMKYLFKEFLSHSQVPWEKLRIMNLLRANNLKQWGREMKRVFLELLTFVKFFSTVSLSFPN